LHPHESAKTQLIVIAKKRTIIRAIKDKKLYSDGRKTADSLTEAQAKANLMVTAYWR
jgi:hypothetical protein